MRKQGDYLPKPPEQGQPGDLAGPDESAGPLKLEYALIGTAILIGLCRAWAGRNGMMDIDGLSYIDIGRAYLRGDWHTAVNPVWSPLYSLLVGAGLKILNTTPFWEIPAVQLINFIIYLITLGCFRFFLQGVILHHVGRHENNPATGLEAIPEFAWIGFGYAAFMVGTLEMIQVTNIRPDMLVAAFFFLDSGIVVRIRKSSSTWKMFFILGLSLGLGYLAKAALFPLAFIFLLSTFTTMEEFRRWVGQATVAVIGLALVAGPFITILSMRQGHLTFSETAPLNYIWFVNRVSEVDFMTGDAQGCGMPIHPLRSIYKHPFAFEFAQPVPGTYPVNFDASYWWAGGQPHVNLGQQMYALLVGSYNEFRLVFSEFQEGLLAGILALILLAPNLRKAVRSLVAQWFIILPPLAGLLMYASVLVLPRYVGSFFAVLWVGIISGLAVPEFPNSRKIWAAISAAVVAVTFLAILRSTFHEMRANLSAGPVEWRVANYLQNTGIQPGDHVGRLHLGYNLGWALLARVRVTTEVDLDPELKDEYLTAPDRVKTEVLDTMFQTGIKAVVADHQEGAGCETGWQQVEGTTYYVCISPNELHAGQSELKYHHQSKTTAGNLHFLKSGFRSLTRKGWNEFRKFPS